MIPPEINGYVCKGDYVVFRWLYPVLAAILFFFSACGMVAAFKYPDDFMPNLICGIMMFCIGLFFTIVRCKSKAWKITYHCDSALIENRCMGKTHSLDTNQSLFIADFPVKYSAKGATWYEHFLILSGCPFPPISGLEDKSIWAINAFWEKNIILLPADDETKAWLCAATGISQIPQYPKVAYLQKDDFWRSCE